MLDIKKDNCTGCTACVNICPKDAITMVEDEEGFYYPKINKEKCINCNLCKKICPTINNINNLIKENNLKEIYGVHILDKDILEKSASGGAFTGIVNSFCDENYVIFGARFDDKFQVIHDYVTSKDKIDVFRKSKYVQSDLRNCFKLAKSFLNEGKKVLFSGTPCQIAGLKCFLRKEYENLLCVDIICHGVPSYKVFNKYLNYLVKKEKITDLSSIKRIEFRKKTIKKEKINSRNLMIVLKNGKKMISDSTENLYLKGYSERLFLRPSCANCKFASKKRYSDITIADCWGIENIYSNINPHVGESLIIINTKKGQKIVNNMKKSFEFINLNEEFVCKYNECYHTPVNFHKKRNLFFDNLDNMNFKKNIKICLRPVGIKNKIKYIIPKPIKKVIKKVIKRV